MNRNRICMRVAVINNLELPSDSEFIVSRNETSPGGVAREGVTTTQDDGPNGQGD